MVHSNNFNLLRVLAAISVVVFHAVPVTWGWHGIPAWVNTVVGFPAYQVSVDVFFAISGFLVTKSLCSQPGLKSFIWARVRRIVPGLFVAVTLTLAMVGLFFSRIPLMEFLRHPESIQFFLLNPVPFLKAIPNLPTAFATNPLPGVANASLWSLPWETRMYALLAVLWVGWRWIGRGKSFLAPIATLWIVAVIANSLLAWQPRPLPGAATMLLRFVPLFFGGAILHLLWTRHRPNGGLALAGCGLWLLVFFCKPAFGVIYLVTLPYLVIHLAYAKIPWVAAYNKLGDYSYGIYIYSFPIQQAVKSLLPTANLLEVILISLAASVAAGALSWHLVESRFIVRRTPAR